MFRSEKPIIFRRKISVTAAVALSLLLAVFMSIGLILAFAQSVEAEAWFKDMVRGLMASTWPLAFLMQLLIALCGILPASFGAITAGALYGTAGGFFLACPATLLGATLAFLISRTFFHDFIKRRLIRRRRIQDLERTLLQDGWKIVCLLRLSPVMPFAVTSYVLGLSSVRLRSFLFGTMASLPSLLLYTLLGDLGQHAASGLYLKRVSLLHVMALGLALVATLLVILRVGWLLTRVLKLDGSPQTDRTYE